jgi:hypothetical protein
MVMICSGVTRPRGVAERPEDELERRGRVAFAHQDRRAFVVVRGERALVEEVGRIEAAVESTVDAVGIFRVIQVQAVVDIEPRRDEGDQLRQIAVAERRVLRRSPLRGRPRRRSRRSRR